MTDLSPLTPRQAFNLGRLIARMQRAADPKTLVVTAMRQRSRRMLLEVPPGRERDLHAGVVHELEGR